MDDFIAITKALSDRNRVRALAALRNGELCVCRIIALLALAPSTVSKHMSVLKHAGLVKSRKEERWIYYRLPKPGQEHGLIRDSLQWLFAAMDKDPAIKEDRKQLARILDQSPESLCKDRIKKQEGNQP
jgi:DNA-binding transcriptional ArsR family regulator